MSVKKEILWRFGVIYLFIALTAVIIIGRIIYLQFFEKDVWSVNSENYPIQQIEIESNRGDIYTSDGGLLALSVPYYEIRMDLTVSSLSDEIFYNEIDSLSIKLAALFRNKSWHEYKRSIIRARNEKRQYYLIKDDVSYEQMVKAKSFPIFRYGRYKGGVQYILKNKRVRPNGTLAARTIGSTTKSDIGNTVGLEGAFDDVLKGRPGVRLYRKIADKIYVPVIDGVVIDPQDGKDIVSTIDLNLQDVAHSALLKQLKQRNAMHGTVVVMEVETGEIKAISNLEKNSRGEYWEGRNFAIGESVEPGSTFKLASMIVAMEDGYVDIDDTIDISTGVIKYYDLVLEDSGDKNYNKVSVKKAFEISSNVGISKIIYSNYKGKEKDFVNGIYKLGLNQKLNLEIKGEGEPEINTPGSSKWSGISLPMMSIGYEVRLTPLQMLTFYNAIANDGKMVKPMFVKEVQYRGRSENSFETEVIDSKICSQQTREKVHEMLCGVVENGTAINLKDSEFRIAGKTGTAQIPDKVTGYRDKSRISYQASFAGYFPADDPKYSCIVVVNSPSRDVYYGNLVAGPVFREIARKVYATNLDWHKPINSRHRDELAQIPFTKSGNRVELLEALHELDVDVDDQAKGSRWVNASSSGESIVLKPRSIIGNLVPNVSDMGLKDALYLLESAGMRVAVNGRGTVKKQSIMPGSHVSKGQTIRLDMSISD
jgi:cell division protein FtsI (penicillin-binding protein 3)